MHPYREHADPTPHGGRADDRTLSVVLVLIGGLRVAIALAAGQSFGAEATIAAILVIAGFSGLIRSAR